MTSPHPPVPLEVTELVRRQLEVLGQTYPGWRIIRAYKLNGTPGGWEAERQVLLTDAQRAGGLISTIIRDDVPALVMALAVQDEIAHLTGYAARP